MSNELVDKQSLNSILQFLNEVVYILNRPQIVSIAKRALEFNQQCGVALMILGDQAKNPQKAIQYYDRLVKIRSTQFDKQITEPNDQKQKIDDIARSYIRSKLLHSWCLWKGLSQNEKALKEYYEILHLYIKDPIGVRHYIIPILLELNRIEELNSFLNKFSNEVSVTWKYTKALLSFYQLMNFLQGQDQDGNNKQKDKDYSKITFEVLSLSFLNLDIDPIYKKLAKKTNGLLIEAFKFNELVPFYLLGKKKNQNFKYRKYFN